MTGKNDSHTEQKLSREEGRCEQTNLDVRYGEIGILAVAAAVRYTGAAKTPADEPAVSRIDQRFVEFAA